METLHILEVGTENTEENENTVEGIAFDHKHDLYCKSKESDLQFVLSRQKVQIIILLSSTIDNL